MVFGYTSQFNKNLARLSKKEQQKFKDRILMFIQNEYDPTLNNHKLHGEHDGRRSINISGNIRLIYYQTPAGKCILYDIGTHSQLYE